MDGRHFDDLARTLSTAASRRLALASGAAALAAVLIGREADAAPCQKVGKRCNKSGDCCKGARCRGGRCRCRQGGKDCGNGRCTNLKQDRKNCGACGRKCAPNERCVDGVCI